MDFIVSHFDLPLYGEVVAVGKDEGLSLQMVNLADPHVEVVIVLIFVGEGQALSYPVGQVGLLRLPCSKDIDCFLKVFSCLFLEGDQLIL